MKKYLVTQFLFFAVAVSTQAESATLDQQQPLYDSGATSYSSGYLEAQTFTAGFNQRLDTIEFYNYPFNSSSSDYPTTITLRETIAGKPTGNDLASLFFQNGFGATGWFSIDFSAKNIFLTEGSVYALVFGNDQIPTTGGPTNGFAVTWNPDAYTGGALWTTWGRNGWQLQTGFNSTGADMAFKTYGTPTVPLPGASWLFGSGFLGLVGMARKRR